MPIERTDVGARVPRLLEQLAHDDRHAGDAVQPMLFDELDAFGRMPLVHQRDLRAGSRCQIEATHPADVKERKGLQDPRLRRVLEVERREIAEQSPSRPRRPRSVFI